MKMKSSGILQRLQLKWVPQPQQCNRMLHVVTEWADIVLPVIGLAASVLISFCILIIELILYKYKHKTVTAYHKNISIIK
jgi:hypothetical protein